MKKQLLETLEKARDYTLSVAELMPEKDYAFKPVGAGWNFAKLLNHIGYGIQWWQANYLFEQKMEWDEPLLSEKKSEVLEFLSKVFQDFEAVCEQLSFVNTTEIMGFFATMDHVTHHRGQAAVYLRCQGIVPTEYIY